MENFFLKSCRSRHHRCIQLRATAVEEQGGCVVLRANTVFSRAAGKLWYVQSSILQHLSIGQLWQYYVCEDVQSCCSRGPVSRATHPAVAALRTGLDELLVSRGKKMTVHSVVRCCELNNSIVQSVFSMSAAAPINPQLRWCRQLLHLKVSSLLTAVGQCLSWGKQQHSQLIFFNHHCFCMCFGG